MIKFITQFKKSKYISSCLGSNAGWFRLFGRGIKWKHKSLGLVFSERSGYVKYVKIGSYIFGYLSNKKLNL